ncbi:MAG: hypothetical protein KC800_06905 [Candidatus Eremiobacteraeota bacterium]|nr:hypothetical protein [Candidatus Eremiobacteraeota bacterium]
MKNQDPLQLLLQEAGNVGRLDSEGSFTISGDAALGKLANFQLPRKSAWILKIVQAAVTAEAAALSISQSNETTTFVFYPEMEFGVDELKEALLSPGLVGPRPVQHLAVGLRAVGFGDGRAFTLALDRQGVRTYFGWNGKELAQRAEALPPEAPPRLTLGVAFPPEDMGRSLGGLAKGKGRATEEYQEIVSNGEVCPIPLLFDGRRIDTMQAPHPDETLGNTATLSVGWTPYSEADGVPPLDLPKGMPERSTTWRPTDKFTDSRVFFFDGDLKQTHTKCIVKLRYGYKVESHRSKHRSFKFQSLKRRSFYAWVKDGVICHREVSKIPVTPISFEVYLSADGLQTDLTGFQIKEDAEYVRRATLGKEQICFQVENTLHALQEHIPRPFSLHAATYGAVGLVFTLVAPMTVGKSLVGAFAFVGLALSAYDKKQIMDDCAHHLRRLTDKLRHNPRPSFRRVE